MNNEQRARVLRIIRDDAKKAIERWKQGLTRAATATMSDHDFDTLTNLMVEHVAESEPTW